MSQLSELVTEYQRTGRKRHELRERIALIVYNYPQGRRFFEEDDAGDFLLYFQPRIDRIIRRFHDQGNRFEAYLGTNLRYQLHSYVQRKQRAKLRHYAGNLDLIWEGVGPELLLNEATPQYAEQRPDFDARAAEQRSRRVFGMHRPAETEDRVNDPHSRRLLLLGMKAADYLEPHHLEKLAILTGYRYEYLFQCWTELRERTFCRRRRLALLQHRRNRAYLQLRCLEIQMSASNDEKTRQRYVRQTQLQRERLRAVVALIERVPRTPTNRDLSAVLGIPKGSIDSGLYALRGALCEIETSQKAAPYVE
ncbi:MAG: hypothetical protein EA428_07810 [Spirochaetaceae bacterium]|nr:MAG: hypothetical protein EA428_07810 [Spirochaetaceae bacterium]